MNGYRNARASVCTLTLHRFHRYIRSLSDEKRLKILENVSRQRNELVKFLSKMIMFSFGCAWMTFGSSDVFEVSFFTFGKFEISKNLIDLVGSAATYFSMQSLVDFLYLNSFSTRLNIRTEFNSDIIMEQIANSSGTLNAGSYFYFWGILKIGKMAQALIALPLTFGTMPFIVCYFYCLLSFSSRSIASIVAFENSVEFIVSLAAILFSIGTICIPIVHSFPLKLYKNTFAIRWGFLSGMHPSNEMHPRAIEWLERD